MSIKLQHYMQDGACAQARAVLAMLSDFNIEKSWNEKYFEYGANITVGRWENCREQGYVLSMRGKGIMSDQLNIAFYEHRNDDGICALMWTQSSINTPTLDSLPSSIFNDKYDYHYSVPYGEIMKMVNWIKKQLTDHWDKSIN